MSKLFRFFTTCLLLGGWVAAIAAMHVIITPGATKVGKFTIIPKDHLTFQETLVDTRQWTIEDEAQHPRLVDRIKAVDPKLLEHVSKFNAPTPPPASVPQTSMAQPIRPSVVAAPQPKPAPEPPQKYQSNIFDDMKNPQPK